MTKGEFVSRVVNGLNSLNKDSRISRRYILNVGVNIVKDFVAKKIEEGMMAKELDILTNIECFEMVPDDVVKCDIIEFRRCHSLMKSKCELPELFGSSFGASVVSVTSLDDYSEYKPVTLKQFRRNLERVSTNEEYKEFYVKDNYLYLPNSHTRRVNVEVLTLFPEMVKECGQEDDDCINIYDTKFVVPAKIQENVVKATVQEIASKKQIPTDENPNLDSLS